MPRAARPRRATASSSAAPAPRPRAEPRRTRRRRWWAPSRPSCSRRPRRAQAPVEETAEWLAVYEDFIRTKKQCGEPTEGLTFEKFSHTLKKNRDALIQRHGCKRVKFTVYVKEGRASLKATPVKD